MRSSDSALLSAALCWLAPALAAQGAVPPAVLSPHADAIGLSPPNVPGSATKQIQLVRLADDAPGTWTCALTVTDLPAGFGGAGGDDLLLGLYDPNADVFLPSPYAAACNSAAREFGAMLDASGLHLVFNRTGATTIVMHAQRTAVSLPFDPPRAVVGLPPGATDDPALGVVAGHMCMFYSNGASLVYAPFDAPTSTIDGPAVVAVGGARPGSFAHSPTPIFGIDGEVTGLSHHDALGLDSDHYLTLDLDPSTPSHLVLDTPNWLDNGGFAGGRFFSAEASPSPHMTRLDTTWLAGSKARIGEMLRAEVHAPPDPASPSVSAVIFGLSFWSPLTLPGFENALGLDPAQFLFVSPGLNHDPRTGSADFGVRVPQRQGLMGLELAWQALTLHQGRLLFSNTASARVSERFPETPFEYTYDGLDRLVQRQVDPLMPVLLVRSDGTNVAPFQLVPQDFGGFDVGPPLTIVPGTVNSLSWPGASQYVARLPNIPGETARFATTLAAQDEWQNHQPDAEYCNRRDANNKYKYQLPSDQTAYCIHIMGKARGDNDWYPSDCRVNWAFHDFDHNGTPVGEAIKSGSMNRYECRTQCLPARRGGQPNVGIVVWCDRGPNICRFRIQFRTVKDCSECTETENYDCR